jgi:hypothetical protein
MIRRVLREELPNVLIEGECRGVDHLARKIAEIELHIDVRRYPADWDRYGKAAGPRRNQQMLDDGRPNEVWAFHDDLANSKGTKDMVERAMAADIPVWHFTHEQRQAVLLNPSGLRRPSRLHPPEAFQ